MTGKIITGDCLEQLALLDSDSFDAVLSDPPYGISFMGKEWDKGVPSSAVWAECLRVLRPGGHLLAFGGTRTHHRLICNIEDGGFLIRDCLMWIYGSGFPKSHNLGNGYGTALKPAWEPICLAMRPTHGTYAENASQYGVAGINIDGSRIPTTDKRQGGVRTPGICLPGLAADGKRWTSELRSQPYSKSPRTEAFGYREKDELWEPSQLGRWPANLILNESFDQPWSRYFYSAKVSTREREAGMQAAPMQTLDSVNHDPSVPHQAHNNHPTLKPISLTTYLATLLLPPKRDTPRRILVPYSGAGSEMVGAIQAGWDEVVGIELSPEYVTIAERRIKYFITP